MEGLEELGARPGGSLLTSEGEETWDQPQWCFGPRKGFCCSGRQKEVLNEASGG